MDSAKEMKDLLMYAKTWLFQKLTLDSHYHVLHIRLNWEVMFGTKDFLPEKNENNSLVCVKH